MQTKSLTISSLLLLTLLASCGDSGGGGSKSGEAILEEQVSDGEYKAFLRPLNSSVNGFIPHGAAEFRVSNGIINAKTYLDDDTQVMHIQGIYSGTACPTLAQDANGDGLVDMAEAASVIGSMVLPLDGDIRTLVEGQNLYPKGKSFTYSKSAPVLSINNELGRPLALGGRVVLIQGTSDISRVPETVQSPEGIERNVSVPIVCGVIKKIK